MGQCCAGSASISFFPPSPPPLPAAATPRPLGCPRGGLLSSQAPPPPVATPLRLATLPACTRPALLAPPRSRWSPAQSPSTRRSPRSLPPAVRVSVASDVDAIAVAARQLGEGHPRKAGLTLRASAAVAAAQSSNAPHRRRRPGKRKVTRRPHLCHGRRYRHGRSCLHHRG